MKFLNKKKYIDNDHIIFKKSSTKRDFAYAVAFASTKEISKSLVDIGYKFYHLEKIKTAEIDFVRNTSDCLRNHYLIKATFAKDKVEGRLKAHTISAGSRYHV